MVRMVVGEFAASFVKLFAMATYSAWAIKIGLIDSNMNTLFAIPLVGLSIFGLWTIVGWASQRIVQPTNFES